MKLIKVRVQNYRSVEDSEEFEIGDLTCLVGKNEAGKTAVLSAMRGFLPSQPFEFDVGTKRGKQMVGLGHDSLGR